MSLDLHVCVCIYASVGMLSSHTPSVLNILQHDDALMWTSVYLSIPTVATHKRTSRSYSPFHTHFGHSQKNFSFLFIFPYPTWPLSKELLILVHLSIPTLATLIRTYSCSSFHTHLGNSHKDFSFLFIFPYQPWPLSKELLILVHLSIPTLATLIRTSRSCSSFRLCSICSNSSRNFNCCRTSLFTS